MEEIKVLMLEDVHVPQWLDESHVLLVVVAPDGYKLGLGLTRDQADAMAGSLIDLAENPFVQGRSSPSTRMAGEHPNGEEDETEHTFALELPTKSGSVALSLNERAAVRLRDRLTAWLRRRRKKREN